MAIAQCTLLEVKSTLLAGYTRCACAATVLQRCHGAADDDHMINHRLIGKKNDALMSGMVANEDQFELPADYVSRHRA